MKDKVQRRLALASHAYLSTGLQSFHEVRNENWMNFQAPLGNLCISVELMLKSLIARRCFRHLYEGLPLELEIKLTYPSKEHKFNTSYVEDRELENFSYRTLELDKCIAIFYTLFPDKKHEYKPYFRLLAGVRNKSVHGAIQDFQKYDLERAAYISMHLMKHLSASKIPLFDRYQFTGSDETFYANYDNNRAERVRKAIEAAKEKSRKVDHWSIMDVDDWSVHVVECPVCQCDATLLGSTEFEAEATSPEDGDIFLTFYGENFECDECGLQLLDTDELDLVNMERVYDRSEEMDKWMKENWAGYGYEDL